MRLSSASMPFLARLLPFKKEVVAGCWILLASGLVWLGFYFFPPLNLDEKVRQGVETQLATVTKTKTALEKAELSWLSGKGTLKNLVIANPENFTSPYLVLFPEIRFEIEPSSLRDNGPVILNNLDLGSPVLFYESDAENTTNIKMATRALQKRSPPPHSQTCRSANCLKSKNKVEQSAEQEETLRFIIQKTEISGGTVILKHALLNQQVSIETSLPTATLGSVGSKMRNALGSKDAGTTASAVLFRLLHAGDIAMHKEIKKRYGKKGNILTQKKRTSYNELKRRKQSSSAQ